MGTFHGPLAVLLSNSRFGWLYGFGMAMAIRAINGMGL